ncbi:MAG TPA: hypothetical protein VFF30_16850 [Nitrososphaerales archaeon]|nr:hypothetical protein [Nitrososphaerales archaeon]
MQTGVSAKVNSNRQVTGNVGMYWVAYKLSSIGWNFMPTSRNAKGIDIVIYDDR